MKYFGMPMGMWMLFGRSFGRNLITGFGLDRDTAKMTAAKAKLRYKKIIAGLPGFEKADRFKMKLAITLSHGLGGASMVSLCCAYLFVAVSLIKLIVDIMREKTYLKRTGVFFTPAIPMAVLFVISQLLPQSPFSYGLYTFCMNGGMLVWFSYLLFVPRYSLSATF